MTTTKTTTPPTDIDLAAELVKLEEQNERLQARISDVKAQLAERHPAKGDYPAGDYRIRVTIANRKDTRKLEAAFPVTQHPELYKPALDSKKVDAYFQLHPELDLANYQVPGSPSIKVL